MAQFTFIPMATRPCLRFNGGATDEAVESRAGQMSTLIDRYRARRHAASYREAIERALRATPSRAVRAELLEMTNR